MPSFALSAIGRDRPGIVAAVAEVLYDRGCNVEDSSMKLLRGNFAIMLILAGADGETADGLDAALGPVCASLGLVCTVREVEDTADVPHPSHILTVYGADKPGILFRVTAALASAGANITDLNSRLVGSAVEPLYAVMLELAVRNPVEAPGLEAALRDLARELGVDMSLRPLDEDIL